MRTESTKEEVSKAAQCAKEDEEKAQKLIASK